MELLAVIILVVILLSQLFIAYLVVCIEKWLSILSCTEPEHTEEAKVTDPFTNPKEVYSSTSSIVVPKTPQEIRNQNFEKIKEGIEYGDIKQA